MNWLLHWLAVHLGIVNEGGPYYGFWSGSGSDIGELALIGGALAFYRRHNCHTHRCWRVARHSVAEGQFQVCGKCHRSITGAPKRLLLAHIHATHHASKEHSQP